MLHVPLGASCPRPTRRRWSSRARALRTLASGATRSVQRGSTAATDQQPFILLLRCLSSQRERYLQTLTGACAECGSSAPLAPRGEGRQTAGGPEPPGTPYPWRLGTPWEGFALSGESATA